MCTTFMPDESIFLMGSEPHCMMVILSGCVQISMSAADGNQFVLAILGPGQIFGEISLLDGGVRTADANAMTECSLAILYRRDVVAFFDEHPGVRRAPEGDVTTAPFAAESQSFSARSASDV